MKYFLPLLLVLTILSACASSQAPQADASDAFSTDSPAPADDHQAGPDDIVNNEDPLKPKTDDTIPRHADDALTRGAVYLDSIDLLTMESFPLQFSLALAGNLPTPCDQLRVVVSPPDAENKIVVDVYSVSTPDAVCIQILEPFSENIPLGSFPVGHYTIWVNGEQVAEFDG